MSRILMISDIHGCITPFHELLEVVQYTPFEDKLVLLGDYVDRGPQSKETVNFVRHLVNTYKVIALRGNHDQRLIDLVKSDDDSVKTKFMEHGGLQTLRSYCPFIKDNMDDVLFQQASAYIRDHYDDHVEFLASLPLYHEDEQHIYVHAGLNPNYTNWREQPEKDFMYIKGEFHHSKPPVEKTIIFGHTRTIELHDCADIWFGQGKIGIDGGCAYGMQLNCLIYDKGHYDTRKVGGCEVADR